MGDLLVGVFRTSRRTRVGRGLVEWKELMRAFTLCWLLAGLMALVGCASSKGAKSGTTGDVQANAGGMAKACVLQTDGRAVLRLTPPAEVVCTAHNGSLQVQRENIRVDVWQVRGAQTLEDAIGRLGSVIESEFKEFKATSTTELTIAGAPARRLKGAGVEADDNDPGTADVVVFRVGGRVFVACTHEEHLNPIAQQWMMTVVGTAQEP